MATPRKAFDSAEVMGVRERLLAATEKEGFPLRSVDDVLRGSPGLAEQDRVVGAIVLPSVDAPAENARARAIVALVLELEPAYARVVRSSMVTSIEGREREYPPAAAIDDHRRDAATKKVAFALQHLRAARKLFEQDALAFEREAAVLGTGIFVSREAVATLGQVELTLEELLEAVGRHHGFRDIASLADWERFLRDAGMLLAESGFSAREAAFLLRGADNDGARAATRQKVGRAKKRAR